MNEKELIEQAAGELSNLRLQYARRVSAAEKLPTELQRWADQRLGNAQDPAELTAAFDEALRQSGGNRRRQIAVCRAAQLQADRIRSQVFGFDSKRELNLLKRRAAQLQHELVHQDRKVAYLRDRIATLEEKLRIASGQDFSLRDRPGGVWGGGYCRTWQNQKFGGSE